MESTNIIKDGSGGGSVGGDIIEKLERKWYIQLREVAVRVDDMATFKRGVCFRSHIECVKYLTKNISKRKFQ